MALARRALQRERQREIDRHLARKRRTRARWDKIREYVMGEGLRRRKLLEIWWWTVEEAHKRHRARVRMAWEEELQVLEARVRRKHSYLLKGGGKSDAKANWESEMRAAIGRIRELRGLLGWCRRGC